MTASYANRRPAKLNITRCSSNGTQRPRSFLSATRRKSTMFLRIVIAKEKKQIAGIERGLKLERCVFARVENLLKKKKISSQSFTRDREDPARLEEYRRHRYTCTMLPLTSRLSPKILSRQSALPIISRG